MLTHRTQEDSREPPLAAATDDEEISVLRGSNEHTSGVALDGNLTRPQKVGHSHAMTASSVAPVTLACVAAQRNPSRDDSEPSTPTTITLFFFVSAFIAALPW